MIDLIEHTPNGDALVVNAARASFNKQIPEVDEKDIKLLNYLAKHKHVLPFRHPHVTFRVTMPIFVARQLGKHQVGMSMSEMSRRYVTTEPEFFIPETFRKAAENVKQGSSSDSVDSPCMVTEEVDEVNRHVLETYKFLLDKGVCPEQARMVLPQSMLTTVVWTGSLLSWFHMYKLRTDSHTQLETQEYANTIGEYLADLYPHSWAALCKHLL